MKEYKSKKEFLEDWMSVVELQKFLAENDYSSSLMSIRRWEESGVIPKPERVKVYKNLWRAYSKDGFDFRRILKSLQERSSKHVSIK